MLAAATTIFSIKRDGKFCEMTEHSADFRVRDRDLMKRERHFYDTKA
jgi:hypothetical protein